MPKTPKHTVKKPNATQDPYRVRTPKFARSATTPDATHQTIETNSKMSTQSALPATPLIPTNGNRRRSSRVLLQSQKEKENTAQQQEGIVVLEDEVTGAMDTTEDVGEDVAGQEVVQLVKKLLAAQALDQRQRKQENEELKQHIAVLEQQMTVIIQQNNETQEKLAQVQQHAEEMETRLHQMQEQNYTGLAAQPTSPSGNRSYIGAALNGVRHTGSATRMFTPPMAEEFFVTIDYSRVEGGGEAVDAVAVRKRIEDEIHKGEDKTFKCRAITRDNRTRQQLRILCRGEEELDVVKRAATATVMEGARVLRDQLYPVKINNVRTDAILQPNGVVKEDALSALNDSNSTQLAKLSWLSSRHVRKAYGSMVVFFTKGSEAARFLRDGFFTVGGESAYVRVFEPNTGPPQCYNCQGLGHKAFSCKEVKRCGKCAQEGHDLNNCQVIKPRCVMCSGPHTVMSRHCPRPHGT